jgi:hypothetical protein
MTDTDQLHRTAVEALDRALRDRPEQLYDDLSDAVCCLVRLRDVLIDQTAKEPVNADRLRRLNALLSLVVGGEYPVQGLSRDRLKKARNALAELDR